MTRPEDSTCPAVRASVDFTPFLTALFFVYSVVPIV
jgi:hypothetical protein